MKREASAYLLEVFTHLTMFYNYYSLHEFRTVPYVVSLSSLRTSFLYCYSFLSSLHYQACVSQFTLYV